MKGSGRPIRPCARFFHPWQASPQTPNAPSGAGYDDVLVTLDRFADRLDPATYDDDDGTVGVFESDRGDEDSLWISERLFRRLTSVASGYELHTLPMLGGSDPVRLNGKRCSL